jgi:hypothetical protein
MGSRESEIATRESAAAGVAAAAEERRREAEGWESRMRKVGLEAIPTLSHIRHRGKRCDGTDERGTVQRAKQQAGLSQCVRLKNITRRLALCGLAATAVDQLLHSRTPMVVLKLCRLLKFSPVCGADGVRRFFLQTPDMLVLLCVMSWFLQELNDKEAQLMRLEGDLRATESELNNRCADSVTVPVTWPSHLNMHVGVRMHEVTCSCAHVCFLSLRVCASLLCRSRELGELRAHLAEDKGALEGLRKEVANTDERANKQVGLA